MRANMYLYSSINKRIQHQRFRHGGKGRIAGPDADSRRKHRCCVWSHASSSTCNFFCIFICRMNRYANVGERSCTRQETQIVQKASTRTSSKGRGRCSVSRAVLRNCIACSQNGEKMKWTHGHWAENDAEITVGDQALVVFEHESSADYYMEAQSGKQPAGSRQCVFGDCVDLK